MPLKPFALLITVVLAWAIVPPTLWHVACAIKRRLRPKAGIRTPGFVIRRWYAAYAFIAVAFGWSTVFLFFPLLRSLHYSLTDKALSSGSSATWVGLTNYASIFGDPLWWKSVGVTIIFIVGTLPYSVVVCLFLASLIMSLPPMWQTFFKTALYVPGVTSLAVSAAIMRWIFYPGDGFANMVMRKLHLISANLTWFGDPHLALPTIIVMSWLGVNGMAVIIYCAALGGIPKDYYEASELDGASPAQKFFHITWPLVKPSTVYVTITGLIGGFQVFAPALLITGGGPLGTTNFMNYVIYRTFYYENQFGRACAMSVALMVLIVTVSIINYRYMATDVEY